MSSEDFPLPVIFVSWCPRCDQLIEVSEQTQRGARWHVCLNGHVIRRVQRKEAA